MKKIRSKVLVILFVLVALILGSVSLDVNIQAIIRYSPITPNETIVPSEEVSSEMSDLEILYYNSNEYPYIRKGAVKLDEPTAFYNSHSYAWYNQDYENNHYTISDKDVLEYINDGSYVETAMAHVGDIICYYRVRLEYTDDSKKILNNFIPYLGHSGIITEIKGTFDPENLYTLKNVTMISKWGKGGLYEHTGDNTPYYNDSINSNSNSTVDTLHFPHTENKSCDDALFYVKVYTPNISKEIVFENSYKSEESIQKGSNIMYKIKFLNSGIFDFIATNINSSNNPLFSVKLFDFHMNMIYSENETYDSSTILKEINLNQGTYYLRISFSNILTSGDVRISIQRKINSNYDINQGLLVDYYSSGSEYLINDGEFHGSTITEGFTRCLYLSENTPSASRLDYDWESSDPNIAMVTAYGTVLALNTEKDYDVTITAIYKYDKSIFFKYTFTILHDTKTTPINVEFDMEVNRGTPTLIELPSEKVPYNFNQDYIWSSSNQSIATVSTYGTIISNTTGNVIITGKYKYNPRVVIKVNVTIV